MTPLTKRLNQARAHAQANSGASMASLAQACDVSGMAVSKWMTGTTPSSTNLLKFAQASKVNVSWLADGLGPMSALRVTKVDFGFRLIPILPRKLASRFDDLTDSDTVELPTIDAPESASPTAFAIIIETGAMFPRFEVGDRVVIDPEIKPLPGDLVCVSVQGEPAIFGKFVMTDESLTSIPLQKGSGHRKFSLKPINQDYPTIPVNQDGGDRLLGTMIEHRAIRRR